MTGHELKNIRQNTLRISQRKLAEIFDKTVATISRWERSTGDLPDMVKLAVERLVDLVTRPDDDLVQE